MIPFMFQKETLYIENVIISIIIKVCEETKNLFIAVYEHLFFLHTHKFNGMVHRWL